MPVQKLKRFLDDNGARYVVISHSPAYTAQEVAASAHIPGRELAKTVMVRLDDRLAMVVVPASHQVRMAEIEAITGCNEAVLATEAEFVNMFPDCELGAMPPFGNLYDCDVYASRELAEDEEIAFNAGSHSELIRMAWKDYERLVKPQLVDLS